MAALQVFLAVALCVFAQVQGQCDVSAEEALGTITVCAVTDSVIADGVTDCTLTCTLGGATSTLSCTGTTLSNDGDPCPACTVPTLTGGTYGTHGDDCDAACTASNNVEEGEVCCFECADTEIATPDGGEITCMADGDFSEEAPACTGCATAAFANCGSCSYEGDDVVCDSCTSGNAFNSAGDACEACTAAGDDANCNQCSDNTCTGCVSGYVLDDSNVCETCTAAETDDHCTACDTNVCTECEDGYELNDSAICEEEESDEDSAVTVKISFLAVLMTSVGAWLFA